VKKGQFEARLLLLVSFGLVAFGLVMVYSATSAAAALQNGDPAYFVKRQGIYATLGLGLMVLFARFRYQRLRHLAPALVISSLALLAAVLVLGAAINGARR
jgi:cell division protein FtsW